MPLGIVLAAAWVEMLSLREIADEIVQNLDFLQTEKRDIPERQRSIRAVFEYAWNLLSTKEQDVLQHLSVFRGSFTRHAAQSVTGINLLTLSALVNKSLLWRNPDNGRFEMHELLRYYAEEQLEIAGELEIARDMHAAYYAGVLQLFEQEFQGHSSFTMEALNSLSTAIGTQIRTTQTSTYHVTKLLDSLTEREVEVLGLVSQGFSNRDIAMKLVISLGTVKTHLNRIFAKLQVKSRTQALLQAKALHILPE
jgi:ATP/maltotriose-dependent transcriptional regulator MalT